MSAVRPARGHPHHTEAVKRVKLHQSTFLWNQRKEALGRKGASNSEFTEKEIYSQPAMKNFGKVSGVVTFSFRMVLLTATGSVFSLTILSALHLQYKSPVRIKREELFQSI